MKPLHLLEYSHVEQELPNLSESMIPDPPLFSLLWCVARLLVFCVPLCLINGCLSIRPLFLLSIVLSVFFYLLILVSL